MQLALEYRMEFQQDVVVDIVKLGVPAGVTQMIFSFAMMAVMRLENSFGVQFITASSIVKRVDGYAMMPNFSFGMAMTTYIGQNVGARKYDRLKVGARQGTLLAIIVATTLTAAILFFGRGVMRGAGDTVTPMMISIFTSVFTRVSLAYLLVHLSKSGENPIGRPDMIYVSLLITWLTGAFVNFLAYRYGPWRRKLPEDMHTVLEPVPAITMEE